MTVTIKINCDNAAFEENPTELSRILHELANRAENGADYLDRGSVRDINGNTVGTVKIS